MLVDGIFCQMFLAYYSNMFGVLAKVFIKYIICVNPGTVIVLITPFFWLMLERI
jgi:hypothetical protein